MELRVLQYFLAVAREQSISAAAQSLHLSQPTLSTQLKALEQELGKQLLIRGSKGSRKVTLTEEGMILRKRAEEILDLVQKAEHEILLSADAIAGDVCIGAGESQAIRLFAKAAKELRTAYPDIHYHIFSGNSVYVMEQLEKGLIDFGLVYGPVDSTKYEALSIPVKDLWGVLMRKDDPLAEKEAIQAEDLWDKPLILSNQKSGGWPLTSWLKRDPRRLNIVATYNLLFNASLLTSEGFGYTLCFDRLINTTGDSDLCFRPLSPRLESAASIVWKKYQILSKAAEKFLQQLEHIFESA
mgnify:FL=1